MQKLLYIPLLCLALGIHSAQGMFKRRAQSAQGDNRIAIVTKPTAEPPQKPSNNIAEKDIGEKLREVLIIDNKPYFPTEATEDSQEEEEEGDEEGGDDDEAGDRVLLRSAFGGKTLASFLPIAQEPIAVPPRAFPLLTYTEEREQELFAAFSNFGKALAKEDIPWPAHADQQWGAVIRQGIKLELLKTIPASTISVINLDPDTQLNSSIVQFIRLGLAAADDAVSIDYAGQQAKLIIDVAKTFAFLQGPSTVDSQEEIEKEEHEEEGQQSLLELGRKLALLKTAPLEQVQLINVPSDSVITPHMKQLFMCKLAEADDAVTIDYSDSSKPLLIIDISRYFTSPSIGLGSSQEPEIKRQTPPARYAAVTDDEEEESEGSAKEQEQVAQPYADRHTLGLKLEWLQKLPPEQIDVINFDPSLTAEEQNTKKQELVALLASTATAVNTNLSDDDFETPRLIIDVSKLAGYAAMMACCKAVQKDAEREVLQPSTPPPAQKEPQQELLQQPSLLQKIGIPVATGTLCFVLGYWWAHSRGA